MNPDRLIPIFLAVSLLMLSACGNAPETASPVDSSTATPPTTSQNTPLEATASDTVRYHGIDVSHHQGDVDWHAVKASGVTFVYAKATEGNDYLDPKFAENWEGIKAAGLVRGAYHFFHPNDSAETQARNFIATVKLEPGDLPPVLDIEVSDGVSRENIDREIQRWLEMVSEAYGIRPIIYSDLSFIEENLHSGFSIYPLWLAEYTDSIPSAPGDWKEWVFWQQSDQDVIEGIVSTVDRSVHHGPEGRWKSLLVPVGQ